MRSWPVAPADGLEQASHNLLMDCGTVVTEEDVEKRVQISEQIEEKLESRPSQDEMLKANEHIINPTGGFH